MITATLTWKLPAFRADGITPADPSEISSIQITSSFAPGNPISLPGSATSFTTGDLSGQAGKHDYTVVAFDTQDPPVAGVAATASVDVPESGPTQGLGPVTDLVVTLGTDAPTAL